MERSKRAKITPREYVDALNALLAKIDVVIDTRKKKALPGVREFRLIRKELMAIKTSFPRIKWSRRGNTSNRKNCTSSFLIQKIPSQELKDFLKLQDGEKVSQIEVAVAIRVYIYLDPNEKREKFLRWKFLNNEGRDLRNPERKTEIIPDSHLANLLGYETYTKLVEEGKVFSKRKDKETGMKEVVQITDPKLNMCVVQKLIAPLLKHQAQNNEGSTHRK